MLRKEFSEWLQRTYKKAVAQSRVSNVERINVEYDLDALYAKDKCQGLLNDFQYSAEDNKLGKLPNVDIEINGDYLTGMATLRYALKLYIEFLSEPCNQAYISSLKASASGKASAVFKGSLPDFKHYMGGYCRNSVNGLAKKERDARGGICECCGQKKILQSAHRSGEERVAIIERILDRHFKKGNDYYEVDLVLFEDLFVKEQTPILDHFFFLCKDCHDKYDGKGKAAGTITTADLLAKRVSAVKP